MYYNLPSASNITLTTKQLHELPISYLKNTNNDTMATTELIQTNKPTLLNNYDTLTFTALATNVHTVV